MGRRVFYIAGLLRDGGPVPSVWHRPVGEKAARIPDVVAFAVLGPLDLSEPGARWRYEIAAPRSAGVRPAVAWPG